MEDYVDNEEDGSEFEGDQHKVGVKKAKNKRGTAAKRQAKPKDT